MRLPPRRTKQSPKAIEFAKLLLQNEARRVESADWSEARGGNIRQGSRTAHSRDFSRSKTNAFESWY